MKLEALHERHVGLTPSLAGAYSEAAAVCLNRHHESPVNLEIIQGNDTCTLSTEFLKPDVRTLNAWANEIDTTEFGAYGISLAAIEAKENLVAIKRAETLTGADWYVAPIGASLEDLEACFRLEVSGLDSGNRTAIETRLHKKIEQTKRGNSNLPAIATVVGFKEKVVAIKKVSEK